MSTTPPLASSSVPALPASDIEYAIALIQATYSPSASSSTSANSGGTAIQSPQSTLLSIQRTPAAWALVLSLLVEDVGSVNLLLQPRITLDASLHRTAPLVVQSVAAVLQSIPNDDLTPALTCLAACLSSEETLTNLEATGVRRSPPKMIACRARGTCILCMFASSTFWHANSASRRALHASPRLQAKSLLTMLPEELLPDTELATLVPHLIALLSSQNPVNNDAHTERTQKIGATLADLLARVPASWGPAVLLEPLLLWAYTMFPVFSSPDVTVLYYALRLPHGANTQLTTHARLLVALADVGVEWVTGHLLNASTVMRDSVVRNKERLS
ncbi:hypothetical protein DFH08DRAFT_970047 [Mycena albidolilacea]|uniref:Uncharacterized protein n=1 Tax=Mycena albidolilacea TaxID=1033008 RepID=A0AAD6ZHL3_9AGAR|nr:hypothetical protein DFH08DRAFT_970047 [Mycena albidolilacea]